MNLLWHPGTKSVARVGPINSSGNRAFTSKCSGELNLETQIMNNITVNGYKYRYHKPTKDGERWRCVRKYCNAYMRRYDDKRMVIGNTSHNHGLKDVTVIDSARLELKSPPRQTEHSGEKNLWNFIPQVTKLPSAPRVKLIPIHEKESCQDFSPAKNHWSNCHETGLSLVDKYNSSFSESSNLDHAIHKGVETSGVSDTCSNESMVGPETSPVSSDKSKLHKYLELLKTRDCGSMRRHELLLECKYQSQRDPNSLVDRLRNLLNREPKTWLTGLEIKIIIDRLRNLEVIE